MAESSTAKFDGCAIYFVGALVFFSSLIEAFIKCLTWLRMGRWEKFTLDDIYAFFGRSHHLSWVGVDRVFNWICSIDYFFVAFVGGMAIMLIWQTVQGEYK